MMTETIKIDKKLDILETSKVRWYDQTRYCKLISMEVFDDVSRVLFLRTIYRQFEGVFEDTADIIGNFIFEKQIELTNPIHATTGEATVAIHIREEGTLSESERAYLKALRKAKGICEGESFE